MEISLFSYSPKNSPLSKVSPGLKLTIFLILIILLLYLNLHTTIILFFSLIVISCFLGFNLKSQIFDFIPIAFYVLFFYLVSVLISFSQIRDFSIKIFIPTTTIQLSIIRLLVTVQLASLFYKTTTSSQLKFSLEQFEFFLRFFLRKIPFLKDKISEKPSITLIFSLVISFIPRIINLWNQLKLAWLARGGSKGLIMFTTLFPQLLSLAFSDAENTWLAILSREDEIE